MRSPTSRAGSTPTCCSGSPRLSRLVAPHLSPPVALLCPVPPRSLRAAGCLCGQLSSHAPLPDAPSLSPHLRRQGVVPAGDGGRGPKQEELQAGEAEQGQLQPLDVHLSGGEGGAGRGLTGSLQGHTSQQGEASEVGLGWRVLCGWSGSVCVTASRPVSAPRGLWWNLTKVCELENLLGPSRGGAAGGLGMTSLHPT